MPRPTSSIRLTDFQKHVAVGTLLGDSSLSKPASGRNFHLSCWHAEKQREWLVCKHTWLQPAARPIQWAAYLDKRSNKAYPGGRFHTVSIPCFTELAALLYIGKVKRITEAYLARFTEPISLACLLADDGSWDGGGIAIATKQFTKAENDILASWLCAQFHLKVTVREDTYPYIRITAASVGLVREACLPLLPSFLAYKFGPDGYETRLVGKVMTVCKTCGEAIWDYAQAERQFCNRRCAVIGRPSGYVTRTDTKPCERCGVPFVVYTKRQTRCADCRELRLEALPCVICGAPVWHAAYETCSPTCNVRLGHRRRKGATDAQLALL